MLDPLYKKPWVVYGKRPFGGPEQVLQYLGRYTHRVGISNARINRVDERRVTFACRDPKNAAKKTTLTLDGAEFLRRFFMHVLPNGFTRIRHYGFLGNAVRKTNVPIIQYPKSSTKRQSNASPASTPSTYVRASDARPAEWNSCANFPLFADPIRDSYEAAQRK